MEERVEALELTVAELRRFHAPQSVSANGRGYLSLLAQYMSEDDVRVLSFQMDIEWDDLHGEGKKGRILSLVQEMERQGRLYQLEQAVREMRPGVDWPVFV